METGHKRFILEFHLKEGEEFAHKMDGIGNLVFPMSIENLNKETINLAFDMGEKCVLKYFERMKNDSF